MPGLYVVVSDEHLPREQALLLGVRSTSEFEYLYLALQCLVVLLGVQIVGAKRMPARRRFA
jgi:hypothetical protein